MIAKVKTKQIVGKKEKGENLQSNLPTLKLTHR